MTVATQPAPRAAPPVSAKADDLERPVYTRPPETVIRLHDVSWDLYYALREIDANNGIRMAYDSGVLELMTAGKPHGRLAMLIGRLVGEITVALEMPMQSLGNTTLRREEKLKGIESDQLYYIQNEPAVRDKEELDLDRDPPPDLGIEVDISRSSMPKLPIYAALQVAEVWRHDGRTLRFYVLGEDGEYAEVERSRAFSWLEPSHLTQFLDRRNEVDETTFILEFR